MLPTGRRRKGTGTVGTCSQWGAYCWTGSLVCVYTSLPSTKSAMMEPSGLVVVSFHFVVRSPSTPTGPR